MNTCTIRNARSEDQAAAYHVCLKTGDHGRDGEPFYRDDPDALGRIYVGPYLAFEPDLAMVLEDERGVCGYVLGALDSRVFYARYEREWRPALCARFPVPEGEPSTWTRAQAVHSSYHQPDYTCPEPYAEYPSHGHIDLLERAQGRGHGRRMMEALMTRLRERGSPGIHLGVSPLNAPALGFYQRLGFVELSRTGTATDGCIYLGLRFGKRGARSKERGARSKERGAMPQTLALLGGRPVRTRPFTSWPVFGKKEEARLLRVLRSGQWGRLQGNEVAAFEQRFAAAHGCRHGIAVVNGTVALRLGLLAAGLRAEDEVIVPPYTFLATASAVVEANMVPVFADVDLDTFNLDPAAVEAAITPRTRAVIPVHFAGLPADMDAINAIARKRKLLVMEDAAHAHAAAHRNGPAGTLADLATFSFQSTKNLNCGEGGIIVTNDARLAETCRSIHNCGRIPTGKWYEHHLLSGNYRLGEFQGALLDAQLDRLDAQARTRDRNGRYLAGRLAALPGLHPQRRPEFCARHAYHLFAMRVDASEFGAPRDALLEALRAEGVPCSAGYGVSLPQQPMFRDKAFGPYLPQASARLDYGAVRCPNSDLICREQGLWIEQSILLGPRADMDDIARAFEKVHEHRGALAGWSRRKDRRPARPGAARARR
jgi:dTDP-4-amino-4,6-dideoxygalactose transaminase/ribosomal protein S18 acetylase RimI-like enzyme